MTLENEKLSETDFRRLEVILSRLPGEDVMNLEMMDGFYAALLCSPESIPPSEYMPKVLGRAAQDDALFASELDLEDFYDLSMRHWNSIIETLQSGEVYLPLMSEDDEGVMAGNDWALGFRRGTEMRKSAWAVLLNDEDHGGALIPILALSYEHDEDPKMRPYKEPMSDERREQLIVGAAAGVMLCYKYFQSQRRGEAQAQRESATYHRLSPKIGRNEPCPCGSGKKFKKCCGGVTVH